MTALEIVSIHGHTFVPPCDKITEALGVELLRIGSQQSPGLNFELIQVGKAPATEILFQLGE